MENYRVTLSPLSNCDLVVEGVGLDEEEDKEDSRRECPCPVRPHRHQEGRNSLGRPEDEYRSIFEGAQHRHERL